MKASKMTLTSESSQAIPGGLPISHPTSREWVIFFSDMTFVNLTLWIETHDPISAGYIEATHVLWCRLMLDDVMKGVKEPKDEPLFPSLADYFAI